MNKKYCISGIRLASVAAGICYSNRDDIVLMELCEGTTGVGIFTQNQFCAAPVEIAKAHLKSTNPRYLIINSGNANAGTGEQGFRDAQDVCRFVSSMTGVPMDQVLPFSTGVIGQRLPTQPFIDNLTALKNNLSEDHWQSAAKAIMTTDTVEKLVNKTIQTPQGEIHITGMAKGSGMICPDMATMLAYIATDAKINKIELQQYLEKAAENTLNAITVDGDTSTNDACILLATGKGVDLTQADENTLTPFLEGLEQICYDLAEAIIKDGEGATKLIKIKVTQAKSKEEAREVAYTVAHSPLVKTALYASDPNWGRILAAVGRAKISPFDLTQIQIQLGGVALIKNGEPAPDYTEEQGKEAVSDKEITIEIAMGSGESSAQILTCDLTCDYVKINADYRT